MAVIGSSALFCLELEEPSARDCGVLVVALECYSNLGAIKKWYPRKRLEAWATPGSRGQYFLLNPRMLL